VVHASESSGLQRGIRITKAYYAARANKHIARFHAKEKQLERLEAERVEKPREGDRIRVAFGAGAFEASCFLFTRDDAFRTIGSLSMGERCRAAFLQLYFSGANLLILDEPTNYLDIDTRERRKRRLRATLGRC
jgi:ATPase subunit of ABC transporter with duplicated ATPase domains